MKINTDKLKELTKENWYNNRTLAESLWVTENYLSNIRSGIKTPSWPLLGRILEKLNTTAKELII